MEIIPVVESLEAELRRIQSPASTVAGLLSDLRGLWPSVALLIAAFAAFVGLVRRLRLLILRYGKGRSVIYNPVAAAPFDEFSDVSSDEDDDSDEDIDDEEEEEEEEEEETATSDVVESVAAGDVDGDCGEDGRQEGSCGRWPALRWGDGAVVRKWDGLGLGFDWSSGGLISLLDLDRGQVLRSFAAGGSSGPSAVSLASPAVVISATAAAVDGSTGSGAAVAVWDARAAGEGTPSAAAKWQTLRRRRVVGIAGGGNGRVYIGDDGGMVTTADLRKGKSTSAAPVVETWWDAAMAVNADHGGNNTAAWRRNAVRIIPILRSPK